MELPILTKREQKVHALEEKMRSIPLYGGIIHTDSRIRFEGLRDERPLFWFVATTTLRKEIQEICYDLFYEYFPEGKLGSD
jgi:hypothetical protein